MSQLFWPYWHSYKFDPNVPMDKLVLCSPNNRIPSYVVAMYSRTSPYLQPGHVYYNYGSFSSGYFVQGTDVMVKRDEFYFLIGGNVSFRPHTEVPENLWYTVGSTKDDTEIYIGTIDIGIEEICGPVVEGVCYVNNLAIYSESENYKILAFNEG